MSVITEDINLGDVLKYEAPNLYSRDQVTVAAGQNLPLGSVTGVVTATGYHKAFDPTATDGTEHAAGVLACDVDATLIDSEAVLIARHAIVSSATVIWPHGLTAAQKATAIAQLKSVGILVRHAA